MMFFSLKRLKSFKDNLLWFTSSDFINIFHPVTPVIVMRHNPQGKAVLFGQYAAICTVSQKDLVRKDVCYGKSFSFLIVFLRSAEIYMSCVRAYPGHLEQFCHGNSFPAGMVGKKSRADQKNIFFNRGHLGDLRISEFERAFNQAVDFKPPPLQINLMVGQPHGTESCTGVGSRLRVSRSAGFLPTSVSIRVPFGRIIFFAFAKTTRTPAVSVPSSSPIPHTNRINVLINPRRLYIHLFFQSKFVIWWFQKAFKCTFTDNCFYQTWAAHSEWAAHNQSNHFKSSNYSC